MCEICLQNPHSSRCPNAPDNPICYCESCEMPLFRGDMVYLVDRKKYCENCVDTEFLEED